MHYKVCEICGLRAGRKDGQKRIFMAYFPRDEERCKQWVKFVGKEDLAYVPIEKLQSIKLICARHFKPEDFNERKTKLKNTAIPSLELTAPPLTDEMLIDFPLHLAIQDPVSLPYDCLTEHNYCSRDPIFGTVSQISTATKIKLLPGLPITTWKIRSFDESQKTKKSNIIQDPSTVNTGETEPEKDPLETRSFHNNDDGEKNPLTITSQLLPLPHILTTELGYSELLCPIDPVSYEETVETYTEQEPLSPIGDSLFYKEEETTGTYIEQATPIFAGATQIEENPIEKSVPTKRPYIKKAEASDLTSRERLLLKRIEKYKAENKILKKKVTAIENMSSPILNSFIEANIRNYKRKDNGKRWSQLHKSEALNIYKKSPDSFKYLSQILPMPSLRTIQAMLKTEIESGVEPGQQPSLKLLTAKKKNFNIKRNVSKSGTKFAYNAREI